jgi:hypothetical protein
VKRVAQLLIEDAEILHSLKINVEELSKLMAGACAPRGSSKANLDLFVEELDSITSIKL